LVIFPDILAVIFQYYIKQSIIRRISSSCLQLPIVLRVVYTKCVKGAWLSALFQLVGPGRAGLFT